MNKTDIKKKFPKFDDSDIKYMLENLKWLRKELNGIYLCVIEDNGPVFDDGLTDPAKKFKDLYESYGYWSLSAFHKYVTE